MTINTNKIFIIGFNKCATRAFHNLFKKSEIKSVHWDGGKLAKQMLLNDSLNKSLLDGYDEYHAYSDMEFVSKNEAIYPHMTMYKKLFHQYPNSYFILNTRDVCDWIESRKAHGDGLYLRLCMSAKNMTEEEITQLWIEEFYSHHHHVISFFKHYERFLHISISNIDLNVLSDFFKPGYSVNIDGWGHLKNHKAKKQ